MSDLKTSLAEHPHLCIDAKLLLGASVPRASPSDRGESLLSGEGAASALHESLSLYHASRLRDGIGLGIIESNRWLILGAVGVGVIVFPPAGALATAAVGAATFCLDDMLQKTIDSFAAHTAEASKTHLAAHLRNLRDQHNEDLDEVTGISIEEARERVFGERRGLLEHLDRIVPDGPEREFVEAHLRAEFDDAVTRKLAFHKLADSARDVRIGDLEKSVTGVVAVQRSLLGFAEESRNRFDVLQGTLNGVREDIVGLREDVDAIHGRLAEQGRSISFLETFAFGRMSPGEQIAALEQGVFPGISDEDRARRLKQARLAERRDALIETAQQALNGANILLAVGDRLGVDPKLIEAGQKAVQIGSAVLGAATAFASGNWIGAAGALSGLLMKGQDAGAARHEQVMGALSLIQQKQDLILQNQEHMMKQLDAILAAQRELFRALGAVSDQIRDSHVAIMDELHRQRAEIRVNRGLILEVLNKRFDAAARFLEMRERAVEFEFENGAFRSYAGLVAHYTAWSDLFVRASEIEDLFRLGATPGVFKLVSYPDAVVDASVVDVERAHGLLMTALEGAAGASGGAWRDIAVLLAAPSKTFASAESKRLPRVSASASRPRVERFLGHLRDALADEPIHFVARWILETHFYFQLFAEPFESFLPAEELARRSSVPSPRGRALLEDVHSVVEAAIAQLALSAGDGISGHVVNTLRGIKSEAGPQGPEQDVLELLSRNPLLRSNVIRLLVRTVLAEAGNNPFVLDVTSRLPSGDGMTRILPGPWEVVNVNAAWRLRFKSPRAEEGAYFFPLPSVEELGNDRFVYSPDLPRLLDLRDRIFAALFGYEAATHKAGRDLARAAIA